jgi:hypothetical protein
LIVSTLLRPVTGSPRRKVAVVLLTPALAVVFLAAAGLRVPAVSSLWLVLVAVSAVLGAAVLATYVPHRGLRPEVGCTPCAAMSAMTVVGAVMALRAYGPALTGPALAVAVTLFGLTQRLGQVDTCATLGPVPQRQNRQEG